MRRPVIRWVALLASALLFAACGSTSSVGGVNPSPSATLVPTTATPPPAGSVSATISLPAKSQLYAMAVTATAVWVHVIDAASVIRIDPQTNKVVATIPVGQGTGDVALEGGFVWVLNRADSTISKIDPQTNKVVTTISLPPPNGHLAASPGAVWVSSLKGNVVRRVDPRTNRVVATISMPIGPSSMSFSAGSLWICGWNGAVWRVDPSTNQAAKRFDIGAVHGYLCAGIAALEDTVWVEVFLGQDTTGSVLERIDPVANTLGTQSFAMPDNLNEGVVADVQGGWLYDPQGGLYHVGPQTNQVVGQLLMKGGGGVALGDGSVWFPTSDGKLLRITPAS
jgi:streptogramin lyase